MEPNELLQQLQTELRALIHASAAERKSWHDAAEQLRATVETLTRRVEQLEELAK